MTLNLLTVSYNYDYLDVLFKSIPKEDNIHWIIGFDKDRPLPDKYRRIPNIHLVESDNQQINKLNACFKVVLEGYFIILDEDSIFHPNAYNVFKFMKEGNYDMGIGQQLWYDDSVRLEAKIPQDSKIDTGSCIASTSLLEGEKWEYYEQAGDFHFWNKMWNKAKRKILIEEPISYYNFQHKQLE